VRDTVDPLKTEPLINEVLRKTSGTPIGQMIVRMFRVKKLKLFAGQAMLERLMLMSKINKLQHVISVRIVSKALLNNVSLHGELQ
jgi:hypothetical protein